MQGSKPAIEEPYAALVILDYLSDLFTASPKETFTREQILLVLNWVINDPELIDPDSVIAYQEATAEVALDED